MSFGMKLFQFEKTLFEKNFNGVQIQIVERGENLELRFGNHIVQSARSLHAPDILVLDYTRAMMACLLCMPRPENALHFGLGGGSLADFLYRHLPSLRQKVVEINSGVIEVAYRFFKLPDSKRLEVVNQDGFAFLEAESTQDLNGQFDLIFLDAFHADGADPLLNTGLIYNRLKRLLTPRGWLVNNVWGSDRENLHRVRNQMVREFQSMSYISVRAESNVIFIASATDNPPTLAMMRNRARLLSQQFPLDFENLVQRVQPILTPHGTAKRTSAASP